MIEFKMPMLGADMEAGTLVEWLKKPGDAVTRGDIIAVVDTQKGAIEIEVYHDGIIDSILVEVGQKVPVGTVLARIRQTDDSAPPPAAAPAAPVPPAPPIVEPAAAMRAAIAAAMAKSKREIPHLYLSTTVDMARPTAWLAAENQKRAVSARLLPLVILLKSVARAAIEVPEVNGFWTASGFQRGPGVHLGCAIALRDGGLIAPALHDVDRKDLDTIMRELADLVTRARAGTLRSSEVTDTTLTVTNLGDLGVETAFGVIYPPQVALVTFGRVGDRPWVVDGRVEARPIMTASVSVDHRALDGRRAAQFLTALNRWLQQPEAL